MLKNDFQLKIYLFDHHGMAGDIHASRQCREEVGANITLMLRHWQRLSRSISSIHASLFLSGLYEDTGQSDLPIHSGEDARAAAYFLEKGADLHVINAFLGPTYGQNQKDILFRMLRKATRIKIDGYTISINRMTVTGWGCDLSLVVRICTVKS